MPQYLLSVHTSTAPPAEPDTSPAPDTSSADGQDRMARMLELEADMQASGTWLFSGRLTDADTATVVRRDTGTLVVTDGPFAESKEHIAGFYIINAEHLDDALSWADRVTACVGAPIEVRPFAATGDLKSNMEPPS